MIEASLKKQELDRETDFCVSDFEVQAKKASAGQVIKIVKHYTASFGTTLLLRKSASCLWFCFCREKKLNSVH